MIKNNRVVKMSLRLGGSAKRNRLAVSSFLPSTTLPRIFFLGAFFLLGISTLYWQTVTGPSSIYLAESSLKLERKLMPPRGLFYDRTGQRLVVNEDSYAVYLSVAPSSLTSEQEDILKGSFKVEVDTWKPSSGRYYISQSLSAEELVILGNELELLPVQVEKLSQRNYLFPELYAHIIGYTGIADENDVEKGADSSDRVGKYRLEKLLEDNLKGIKGLERKGVQHDYLQPAVVGDSVILTIDHQWQTSMFSLLSKQVDALGAQAGAFVIVDTSNGEIVTYASYPSYDPNAFVKGISQSELNSLLGSRQRPLVDKIIGLQAAPGSTYKIVSAYAILENSIINASSRYVSNGCMKIGDYDFCEFAKRRLGSLDVVTALSRSSNIFFCQGSLNLVSKQNIYSQSEAAKRFFLGELTGIELEGELKGVLASPEYKQNMFGEGWFGGDTCNTAIGQGMVATTPLQMAMTVSAMANGGKYYRPHVVKEIVSGIGVSTVVTGSELIAEIPMSRSTQDLILEGMRKAAQEPGGTGYAYLNGIAGNIRVKTGSAETSEERDGQSTARVHSWVVGTFENGGKTYAFAGHIHFGGGAWNVTPVFRDFMRCLNSNFPSHCRQ